MSTTAGLELLHRAPNPIYFRETYFRVALISALTLTLLAGIVAATQFTLGSPEFIGMTVSSGFGFVVTVALVIIGSYPSRNPKDRVNGARWSRMTPEPQN